MMLRPALRTSHSAFCGACVGHLDHAAGQAEVAHQLDEARRARAAAPSRSSPANSTSRIASGSPISARSITGAERRDWRAPGRSSCGRPARPPSGFELDDVLRRVHRLVEGREVHDAQRLVPAAAARACSVSARVSASVPSLPTSRCARLTRAVGACRAARSAGGRCRGCSRRRGAAPSGQRARSRRARRRRAPRTLVGDRAHAPAACPRPHRTEARRAAVGQASRRCRARCAPCCRSAMRARAAGVVARHAAERGLRRGRDVDRDTRGRAASASALSWSSTTPGCDRDRAARSASKSTTSRRCLRESMTSAAPTVWPHCAVPAPRGRIGTPQRRARCRARARRRRRRAARPRRPASIW